jgi:hypothetical protein
LHVLLFSLRHATGSAGPLGTLNYLWGWVGAALKRDPRAEPKVRAHIRRDELRRIRRRAVLLVH